ncbi:MAG: tetratricopeptide repeat protein [Gemmatimonadota bacterium]|nr:MAG: tetratricopeptide repeat protein [Gemmatimonadota bacterium]
METTKTVHLYSIPLRKNIVSLLFINTLFTFVTILISLNSTYAETAATRLFNKANQLYEEGKYEEAIVEYERITGSGIENGYVYYNLGNAYFNNKQLGRAILSFERARRLLPRDEDIKANLEHVKLLTVDKIETPKPGWIAQLIIGLHNLFSLVEVTVIVWILYITLCLMIVLFILSQSPRMRSTLLHTGAVALALLILTGGSLFFKVRAAESTEIAVVMAPKVDARSGPGDEYTKMFTLHEGTKVKIRQSREGWHLISIPGGTGGWIEAETVERI